MNEIVFQGEPGSNSHIACGEAYPDLTPRPMPTFEDCFAAVSSGEVELGLIPIENSLAGRVADIHHLLPHSDLHIAGEHFMPIRFQLLGLPEAELADIRTVHSHIHALGQCRNVIRGHGWKPVTEGDTAGSARMIAERGDPSAAAIAPLMAAELYNLKVLKENIEDESYNVTRFIALSRKAATPPRDGLIITSFVFKVRNVPAALYKVLGGFATNGVNMTKLESYQLDGRFFATQFYAEVDGHPEDRSLQLSLEEMDFYTEEHRILGVFPAHPLREQLKAGASG